MENDLKMSEKWTKNANCERPYITDPSLEDSIRLCGNQHKERQPISIRFDLGNWGGKRISTTENSYLYT